MVGKTPSTSEAKNESKRPTPFKAKDVIKILLWSERHCCLCEKPCNTNIVVHHIEQKGAKAKLSNIDNAIPLCYDCHGRIKSYNPAHRVGTSYKIAEIKARRNQIYDKYTRHLVPLVTFNIEQGAPDKPMLSTFPTIITYVAHRSPSLPVKARIEVKKVLGNQDLGIIQDEKGYYSGETDWHLNPASVIRGNFSVSKEYENQKDFRIEARLTVIDEYERPHTFLPQAWTWVKRKDPHSEKEQRYWFLEPRSFTNWVPFQLRHSRLPRLKQEDRKA
jgi:hypothetical protein